MLSLHGTTNNPPDNKELFVEYKVSLADWYKEYLKDANRCSADRQNALYRAATAAQPENVYYLLYIAFGD
ncbi:hypothetical protein AGMMS49941_13050 [Deferribacterales bacterium]|nr:hypothetical protein AGMMS49941_13050 [Deferribacterales bacterium]